MFSFALVLGFIIELRFPKNTGVCDVINCKSNETNAIKKIPVT